MAKEFKNPIDPVQQDSILCVNPPESLAPKQNLEPSHRPSPPVTLHDLGPVASQLPPSLSLSFQHPSHRHAAKKCPRPFCVSMPMKKREQKGKAIVINEGIVHAADGDGNGNAKVAQKRPVQRRKSECANAKPRTKLMKEPSRKKKGVRVEETTTMASIDKPIRENYSWTDEN